jgi:hypothetical protein
MEKVEEVARAEEQRGVKKRKGVEDNAESVRFEFVHVSEFLVGDRVIFVDKEQDGNVTAMDVNGLYVVRITEVNDNSNGKGKNEEDEEIVVKYQGIDKGDVFEDEAYASQFFKLPERRLGRYPKNHLVLFQRTVEGREDRMESLLEVGWLTEPFTSRKSVVLIDSFVEPDVVGPDFVLFDVFEGATHNTDVEFRAVLLDIEYSDNKNCSPNDE